MHTARRQLPGTMAGLLLAGLLASCAGPPGEPHDVPVDAAPADGASADGASADGAPNDAAPADGASPDGAAPDGAPNDAAPVDAAAIPDASEPAPDAAFADAGSCGGADLLTDPLNCGSCGHDCVGGTCTAGVCDAVTMAVGLDVPLSLAVDATHVYLVDINANLVQRQVKDGSAPLETIAAGLNAPRGTCVDATYVYFVDYISTPGSTLGGTAWRVVKDGSAPAEVLGTFPFGGPIALAADDTSLYVLAAPGYAIHRFPKAGGAPTTVVASWPSPLLSLAVDSTDLYVTGTSPDGVIPGSLSRLAKDGTGPVTIVDSQPPPLLPIRVVVAGDDVYVAWWNIDAFPDSAAIDRVSKTTGVVTTIAGGEGVVDLAADALGAAWVNPDFPASVWAVGPTDVAGSERASGYAYVKAVAVDATAIYWVTQRVGMINGVLYRVAR